MKMNVLYLEMTEFEVARPGEFVEETVAGLCCCYGAGSKAVISGGQLNNLRTVFERKKRFL